MKKLKHIYDPLFRQNYYWTIAGSFKDFREIVKEELSVEIPLSLKEEKSGVNLSGRVEFLPIDSMRVPVIWMARLEPPLVVHECWHAVYDTLKNKGIILSDDSEEVFAYSLEFLVKNIIGGEKCT